MCCCQVSQVGGGCRRARTTNRNASAPLPRSTLATVLATPSSTFPPPVILFVLQFEFILFECLNLILICYFVCRQNNDEETTNCGGETDEDAEREEQAEGEEAAKWVNIVGGPFSKDDNFCADLRRLQQRSGCSNTTCEDFLTTFRKYLGIKAPKNWKSYDKKMHEVAGAEMLRLNGCPKCGKHVYLPESKAITCPHVQANGAVCGEPRYDENGKPKEVGIFVW